MKTILLAVVLIANGVALVFGMQTYLAHRRSGEPLPWTFVSGVMAQIGILLMLAAVRGRFDEKVATVLLSFALLLTTSSAVITFRARQQLRRSRMSPLDTW